MERTVSRRVFLRNSLSGAALSLMSPGPLATLFSTDHTKLVLDISGYKIPSVDPNNDGQVISDLESLSATSAVIVNPSLHLVNSLRRRQIEVIVRPYMRHNKYHPEVLKDFLHYPRKLTWLPFVEPNIPEVIREKDKDTGGCQSEGRVTKEFHDPEEFAVKYFVPAAKAILGRNGGEEDIILLPPNAQWAPGDEFHFAEAVYRTAKMYLPPKNLGIAQHQYIRETGLSRDDLRRSWSRNVILADISAKIFGQNLPLYITEAGLFQDSGSNFPPEVVADETAKFVLTPIPNELVENLQVVDIWNLGFLKYAPGEFHNPTVCNKDQIHGFEKAAIVGMNGPTETYYRLRELKRRRQKEL